MKLNVLICLSLAFNFVKCGLEPYITGGDFVMYKKYPHSVYLSLHCNAHFMCGGSILNQNMILTAAHCLDSCKGAKKQDILIKYGHETIERMKTTDMKNYKQHEDYVETTLVNDICLISAQKKIPLNHIVKRVILMKHPPMSEFGFVAGWGLDEKERLPVSLKHTSAVIQKLKTCKNMGRLPRETFCAGPISGLGAANQGDSGSALIINNFIQIGIVSFKVNNYALVAYTNVSMYINWIRRTSKTLYCSSQG